MGMKTGEERTRKKNSRKSIVISGGLRTEMAKYGMKKRLKKGKGVVNGKRKKEL